MFIPNLDNGKRECARWIKESSYIGYVNLLNTLLIVDGNLAAIVAGFPPLGPGAVTTFEVLVLARPLGSVHGHGCFLSLVDDRRGAMW